MLRLDGEEMSGKIGHHFFAEIMKITKMAESSVDIRVPARCITFRGIPVDIE